MSLSVKIITFIASLGIFIAAAVALWNHDWPQACAWLLADISLTIGSISARLKP